MSETTAEKSSEREQRDETAVVEARRRDHEIITILSPWP